MCEFFSFSMKQHSTQRNDLTLRSDYLVRLRIESIGAQGAGCTNGPIIKTSTEVKVKMKTHCIVFNDNFRRPVSKNRFRLLICVVFNVSNRRL